MSVTIQNNTTSTVHFVPVTYGGSQYIKNLAQIRTVLRQVRLEPGEYVRFTMELTSSGSGFQSFVTADDSSIEVIVNNKLQITTKQINVGYALDAGLPNILGKLVGIRYHRSNFATDGVFLDSYINTGKSGGSDGSTYCTGSTTIFNAMRMQNIYGNSETVTPKSLATGWYIKY